MEVARVIQQIGARRQFLVTRAQLLEAGVSAQALSRSVKAGAVVRVGCRVYSCQPLEPAPEHLVTAAGVSAQWVRWVRATLLSLGGTATACGPTAAALFGWPLLVEPRSGVHVAVRHGRSGAARVDVTVTQRRSAQRVGLVAVPGTEALDVTSPVQTVLDCCRTLPRVEAVVLCDSALRSGLVSMPRLEAAARPLRGHPGARQLRAVLAASDARSGSVLETLFRLRMVAAGVTGFRTQVVLRDRHSGRVLRVDFCFPAHRLVVEVDGAAWHREPALDRGRDNRLAAAGWRVLRFGWVDVVHGGPEVIALLDAALGPGVGLPRPAMADRDRAGRAQAA